MTSKLPDGVRLGPYDLVDELGEGGMGRVFLARHRGSGREVALKAITSGRAASAQYRRAFRREAEAIARVDHPLVTTIYDFGEATTAEAAASGSVVRAGTPWLAMEYCRAGSMTDDVNRPRNARILREVLSETLEALAYAHSRGILHRDLKPENILVQRDESGSRQVRLADFGIAQAFNEALVAENTAQISAARAGTPSYMAPEQIVAEWRNWGTWTDLYALGVIAYEWAFGQLPFVADNWIEVGQMHLQNAPPRLKPLFPMPDAFVAWIERLLAKAPFERYERAADALYALHRFEVVDDMTTTDELPAAVWASAPTQVFDGEEVTTQVDSGPLLPEPGLTQAETLVSATTMTMASNFDVSPTGSGLNYFEPSGEERAFHGSYSDVPPMPRDWRTPRSRTQDVLSGGVSLFGLREVPLVGRTAERDHLWHTLEVVRAKARSAVTFIEGDTGVGKSALAQWFVQRADETGAGFILKANHEESEPEGAGLRRMMTTIMRCHGLNRRAVHDRVALLHHFFGNPETREYDVPALTQIIAPRKDGDVEDGVPRFKFPTEEARWETILRLLRHLARVRPLVLWLDDVHWSPQSLRFARYVLNQDTRASSVYVIATVRSDLTANMRAVRREIDTISAHPNANSIDVGPMPTDEMSELVRAMVRLTPELRDSVVNAAAGRPVHAIQLIGHLVEKSGLAAASNGYELAPDATLPATIEDLWMLRVDEALSSTDSPIAAKQAITLAALLGMRIERRVWVQICKRTGVGAAEQVLENFATSGLIERVPGGSRLRHDLLRFALENTARSGGEWAMYQWMCADIIEVVENPSAERELRRAHHLVDGGFYDEALGILVEDLSHTVIDTRISLSRDAAELAERALDELTGGNPKSDSRWGQVRAQRLIADRVFHDMKKEAAAPLLELLEWANEHDDQATLADAHQMRAERLIRLGEPLEAVAEIEAYGKAAERLGDPRRLARAYNMLALVWNEGHDHERALAYAERGVEILRGLGGSIRLGWSLLTLANIANQLSLFERAEELVSESAKLFREHGVLGGEASAQVVLAQICRKSGRLLQAKAAAERGIDIASQMGSTRYPMATIVLHAILVERGDHDAATDLFDQRIDEIDEGGHMHYAAFMRASALISFATRGDMDRFDQAFEASWAFWEGGSFDSELPGIFERAAEILAERGEVERAERVQQALDHYRRMVDENLAQWRRYG